MRRRARTVFLVLLCVLAAGLLALFVWLPWNPFEADAGPLDAWVPADVDAFIRLDAGALQKAPAVRALWDGPAGRRLRDDFDLDAKLDYVKRADAALTDVPFTADDPPTVERDLFRGEALVALRGDDLLFLTRISSRAKAIDLVCRVREERREDWGIRIENEAYVVTVADERELRFARRRDVLIVSTSRELLETALALADGRAEASRSIDAFPDYLALRPSAAVGAKAVGWASARFLASRLPTTGLIATATKSALARGVSFELDFGRPTQVGAELRAARGDASRVDVGRLDGHARALCVPGETFAAGALPATARDAVQALVDSQPQARRLLVEDLLGERGSSVEQVVRDIARHFEPGVGFVVARLAECDRLRLDDPDGDPVEPLPATVAVFRLADDDAEPLLADLRRHAEALFGEDARLVEAPREGARRWFTTSDASFGPEWAFLRPALVVENGRAEFSTNEAYLRRAHKAAGGDRRSAASPAVATVRLDAAPLAKRLDDLRWEVADRRTWRDWGAERGVVREDLARRFPSMPVRERERREDDEIARRVDERKRRLFPDAVRGYRESLRWLAAFESVDARATVDGDVVRVVATIALRAP